MKKLTVKQEKFCQAYVKLGDKSAAYREAYSTSQMKPETINRKAFELYNVGKITARIENLQEEIAERNRLSIDDLVQSLSYMVKFDISDLYDQSGSLRNIHDIPKNARLMIEQLDTLEEKGGQGEIVGYTKKIRTIKKLDAIEKLMKHLGGYERDNKQKTPPAFVIYDARKENKS